MGNKTVIVILGAATLLLCFIFFFEKGSLTTTEKKARADRVFKVFNRDKVDSLTIEGTGGGQVVMQKVKADSENTDEHWKIVKPRELLADESQINQVLSAIDYLIPARTIKGKQERTEVRYGLQSPRLKASFSMDGKVTAFKIGADAQGEAVYLGIQDIEGEFYAVEEDFLKSVDKGLDELRSKKLVSKNIDDAVALKVSNPQGGYSLRREQGKNWQIEMDGAWVLAAGDQVSELIEAVQSLKAEHFVKEGLKEDVLAVYGVGNDAVTVETTLKDGQKVGVKVGGLCQKGEHLVYVTVIGTGAVACSGDKFPELLSRPKARLREMRPAVFADDEVTDVTLLGNKQEIVLTRTEDGWKLPAQDDFQLDQESVSDMLSALRDTRAREVIVGVDLISKLKEPDVRVTLKLANQQHIDLAFYRDNTGGKVLLRRGDEAALLTLSMGLLEKVLPDALAFRKRKITNGDQYEIEKLDIQGPATQKLAKIDGAWKIKEPVDLNADGTGADRVAELIAEVKVERFVAKSASKDHGFDKPFAIIRADFVAEEKKDGVQDRSSTKEVVLELGAKTGRDKRFARLRGKDETVFVLGEDYENVIKNPLVARDLIQIDESEVIKVNVVASNKELVFEKKGENWVKGGNPSADTAEFKQLLTDLSSLKAVRAASFETNINGNPDTLVVQVWKKDDEQASPSIVFRVKEKSPDPKENGYFANSKGLPVTFVIPARIVDDFLSLTK